MLKNALVQRIMCILTLFSTWLVKESNHELLEACLKSYGDHFTLLLLNLNILNVKILNG